MDHPETMTRRSFLCVDIMPRGGAVGGAAFALPAMAEKIA